MIATSSDDDLIAADLPLLHLGVLDMVPSLLAYLGTESIVVTISKTTLILLAPLLALVSPVAPLFAQQAEQPTVPATINTAYLRPGMRCHVTLETPPQPEGSTLLGYEGFVALIKSTP